VTERSQLIAWFALGVAVQVLLSLRDRVWTWKMLAIAGGAVFGAALIGARSGDVDGSPEIVALGLGLFALFLALGFQEELLPVVNDRVVLCYTLALWYALALTNPPGTERFILWSAALIWPTGIAVKISLSQTPVTAVWKVVLYGWFLCTVVGLGLMQYTSDGLVLFNSQREVPWISAGECVMAGMASLYLAVNAFFLFYLVPIPRRSRRWSDQIRDWHAFTALLTQKYDGDPPRIAQLFVILVGEGGVLWVNYRWHWIPAGFLINTFIVLPAVVALVRDTPTVPVPALALEGAGSVLIRGNSKHRRKNRARNGQ